MNRSVRESWSEISPYLDEVLDLEPAARDAWLADLELRAPHVAAAVRAHLRELAELKAQDFLDVAVPVLIARSTLAGQRFGAYTLDCVIGHGGMGTVWRAHRSDGRFEGEVAVKLLNTALVGHPSERRLAREGRVLAKLQHPNIAHLLDAGVGADNQPYLVLEQVRGVPIDRYCEMRKLGIRERLTLFLDVLGAVAHAHGHLVVHRDLKPSNILVTEGGVVKLLDFGIAALLSPEALSATDVVHPLAPGLTPGYAAPEQLLGEPITIATDVYALGALLFLLLAGRHPILAEGQSRAQWMRAVLDADAPRVSERAGSAREQRALRGDLDNIVAMALRRVPAERYATVDHFAQDLRRYLAFEPVSARPRSLAYLARMFARRHRVAVAAGVAIAAVIAVAMVITTRQMLEARYQRDQARFQSRRAEASIDFLTQLMRTSPGVGERPLDFHARLDLGVEMLKQRYQDDPHFAGRMLVDLGDYYGNDGETARAIELYSQAYQLAKRNDDSELMAMAQCNRAYGDSYAGNFAGTAERIDEAQRMLDRMPTPDVALRVGCLRALSALRRGTGDMVGAEEILRRAMSVQEHVDGSTQTVAYASLLGELGGLHFVDGRPLEALRLTQLAGQIYDRNGRGPLAAGMGTRYTIATILTDMGEVRQALEEREGIWQRVREGGRSHVEHVAYPISHARLLLRMEKPEAADVMLEGVVERARQSGNSSWLAAALLTTAWTDVEAGRWQEAEQALAEALPKTGGDAGNLNTRIGARAVETELALARGDVKTARRVAGELLELAGYRAAEPQRSLSRALLLAARAALADHAAAEAEQLARESLKISEAKARGGGTSADVGEALLRIAEARVAQGSGAETRLMLERAVQCLSNGLAADHPLTVAARQLLIAP